MFKPIYNVTQIREWDTFTIKNEPIASIDLMERAAHKCVDFILKNYEGLKLVNVFAGVGNNGGDGLVIARALAFCDIKVHLFIVEFSKKYSKDFSENLEMLGGNVIPTYVNEKHQLDEIPFAEMNIDAIFGSGLTREIEDGWLARLIGLINKSDINTLSIDFPSGLFGFDNRKNSLKNVIKANVTLTFQIPKLPFFFSKYAPYVGDFKVINIGLHTNYRVLTHIYFAELNDIRLKTLSKFAHKGTKGHLLVVGGFKGMFGAVTLCAKAAYKTGCGYVFVKMQKQGRNVLLTHLLEAVMIADIKKVSSKIKAIAIGCGLGQSQKSLVLLKQVLSLNLPIVIDADAINLLSNNINLIELIPENSVLTPHVKELERLIGVAESEEELLERQIEFSTRNKVFVLQKGAYSKLSCPDGNVFINSTGNEGMAVAGMGDVLTGIIGAFLAQGYNPKQAALYGMLIHGKAGDTIVLNKGKIGFLPSELLMSIPKVINQL
ncbi:MAG TPA: NAD(P)H-hydrate dehydratase [Crocinitomix sp.]|nr:NAD(P)H-hydrate dehydratase [Crocinitomix sp.]